MITADINSLFEILSSGITNQLEGLILESGIFLTYKRLVLNTKFSYLYGETLENWEIRSNKKISLGIGYLF